MANNFGILVIDAVPLLEEAMDACQKACREIERLKGDLHRHESVDLPAYERWYNASFGGYLTAIREAREDLRRKEQALASIRKRHWAGFFGSSCPMHEETTLGRDSDGRSGVAGAYASWHGHPDPEEAGEFEESEEAGDPEEGSGEEYRYEADGQFYHDDEQDHHYGEDEASARQFEDLFMRGTGRRGGAGYRARAGAHGGGFRDRADRASWRQEGERGDEGAAARASFEPEPSLLDESRSRLKERYRLLVRKLHPDLNSNLTAEEKELWNQVQRAYHERDLEKLDLLIALSDAFSGDIRRSGSLFQLRRAAREIDRLISPLRRKLDDLKQHRAWKFSELRDRSPLSRAVEAELRKALQIHREAMVQADAQIARFTRLQRNRERSERPLAGERSVEV